MKLKYFKSIYETFIKIKWIIFNIINYNYYSKKKKKKNIYIYIYLCYYTIIMYNYFQNGCDSLHSISCFFFYF